MKKQDLLREIKEDKFLKRTDNFYEAIYIIGDYMVSGNLDYGLRTVDHGDLLHGDCTWEELLHYGTILVPEHRKAIGRKHEKLCRMYGYEMLPVHSKNHIMGWW